MTNGNGQLLTIEEAAKRAQTDPGTIISLIGDGTLGTVKMDEGKTTKVHAHQIAAGDLSYTRREDDKVEIPEIAGQAIDAYIQALTKKHRYDDAASLASWMSGVSVEGADADG